GAFSDLTATGAKRARRTLQFRQLAAQTRAARRIGRGTSPRARVTAGSGRRALRIGGGPSRLGQNNGGDGKLYRGPAAAVEPGSRALRTGQPARPRESTRRSDPALRG